MDCEGVKRKARFHRQEWTRGGEGARPSLLGLCISITELLTVRVAMAAGRGQPPPQTHQSVKLLLF